MKWYVFVDDYGDLYLAYPGHDVTAGYWFFEYDFPGNCELLGEL